MKITTLYIKGALAAVIAAALLASCSNEVLDRPEAAGQEVVFTVAPRIACGYENSPATYASAAPVTSAAGGVSNLVGQNYLQRYILEVWSEDLQSKVYRQEMFTEVGAESPKFSPRLLAKSYRFALWADFVFKPAAPDQAAGGDFFYNTTNLNNIYLDKADWNYDAKDAYACAFDADLTEKGQSISAVLRRPLAKVRVVALDADKAVGDAVNGVNGCRTNIAFSNLISLAYNVLEGRCETLSDNSAPYGDDYLNVCEDYGNAYANANHSQTIAWDYVFVPAGGISTSITIRMDKDGTALIFPQSGDSYAESKTIEGVTLKPNTLTTAVGNFFTAAEVAAP